jgi:hypothetical protein
MKATIIRPGAPPEHLELPTRDRALGPFTGRWRIVDMELWDADAFDAFAPAELVLGTDGFGTMTFIAVQCDLDVEREDRDGRPGIAWCWRGWDDSDESAGRGWAVLSEDGSLSGRVYIHHGDASDFRAERVEG